MFKFLRDARRRLTDPIFRPRRFVELEDRRLFLRKALLGLRFNGITGDYCEFGVGTGATFVEAWRECERLKSPRRLWGFDSFEGLPPPSTPSDSHPEWKPGAYAVGLDSVAGLIRKAGVPEDRFTLVPGYFDQTLADVSSRPDRPDDIALANIDCDMYSSTKPVLAFLKPRLKQGMILAFDDYFCTSQAAVSGERLCLREFARETPEFNFLPYAQYGWAGMSFIVEESAALGARPAETAGYF